MILYLVAAPALDLKERRYSPPHYFSRRCLTKWGYLHFLLKRQIPYLSVPYCILCMAEKVLFFTTSALISKAQDQFENLPIFMSGILFPM